tara:strand:+ start:220 stop:495 length:276 start_codon:yes stop_codon:yes gene_type:complete
MPKDKLNLDQLMNNLNQVGLNVINFDDINIDDLDEREVNRRHTVKVEKLTIADCLQLSNDGFIPDDLIDKLYYYLLDSKKIRKKFKKYSHI